MSAAEVDTWNPPLGRLFVREMTWFADGDTESSLGFVDEPEGPSYSHYQSIAQMRYGEARPDFCGWVECCPFREGKTGGGSTVRRREASDDDLRAFRARWEARYDIDEWLESVARTGAKYGLALDEVARLRRIFTEAGP